MRRLTRILLIGVAVLGCGPPAGSADPSIVGPTSVVPSPPASQPPTGGLGPGMVAQVVTDDLRVRTAPGATDEATILEPLLQRGTMLYVTDGPFAADGYAWFEVLTFDVDLTPRGDAVDQPNVEHGWVAAADTTGEQWLGVADVDCPQVPRTVADLVALEGVAAVECFGGAPLTITARVFDCEAAPDRDAIANCGMDTGGPAYEPEWFDRTFQFLAPDDGSEGPMYELHADPDGTFPDPLPLDAPLLITGLFNHPEAHECRVYHYFKDNVPSVHCRAVFVVTEITSPVGSPAPSP